MNSEWINCEIADLGNVVGGATPSTKKIEYYNGEIPWITPKDLSDHKSRFINRGERNITLEGLRSCSTQILPKNTVLFSSRAPIGYVAIAANDLCTNQGFKSVIPNDKTDFMFLFYLLKYNKDAIENMASGTTFKEVSGATMRKIVVRVPDLETQKKIAKVLSALDDKIELNNQINKNLEEQANRIVKEYCQSVSSNVRLSRILSFVNGFAFQSKSYVANGRYRVITIKNVKDGEIDSNGAPFVDCLPISMKQECILGIGDVVVSLTGNVGRVGIVYESDLLLNQRVAKIVPYDKNLLPFLYFYFRMESTKISLETIAKGTAQQNLSTIETLKLELPYNDSIKEMSKRLKFLFETIVTNQRQNKVLSELRETLLPKLMSGEIDVDNVKI